MRDLDDDPEGRSGRVLLGDVRARLRRELGTLIAKHKNLEQQRLILEAQREALGEELREVDAGIVDTRRMLGLVEATEQQLAAQERDRPAIEKCGPRPSTQVRGLAMMQDISARCGSSVSWVHAVAAYAADIGPDHQSSRHLSP
jgi:hypothetical protein